MKTTKSFGNKDVSAPTDQKADEAPVEVDSPPEPAPQDPNKKTATETEKNDQEPTAPREEEFGIPTSEEEYESMVERMATCGFTRPDLDKILETKRTAFNKATREFRIQGKKKQTEENKTARKTRKNSIARSTQ